VIDTASYSRATGPIRLTFSTGRVTGNASVGTDSFARTAKGFRIDQVVGTRFDDVLDGSGVNLARMEGGPGNDRIIGGGKGMAQRVVYRTARSAVTVNLQKGIGRNRNGANRDVGVDTLVGITMVSGSAFDDILVGNRAANVFNGGGGADRLRGGPGADEFFLLLASDSTPAAPDVIEDFSGDDYINLTALGVTALVKGPIPSGPKKVARFRASGGDGVLDIDIDSDPQPEARVLLPGVTRLTNRQVQLVGETDP
jgi:Ca2+-binding RTX toxin-like protein